MRTRHYETEKEALKGDAGWQVTLVIGQPAFFRFEPSPRAVQTEISAAAEGPNPASERVEISSAEA